MDADPPRGPAEPDVARLFAPVAVEETFGGVLIEARQVLGALDDPVDAELWGSDLIGALASSAAGLSSLMDTLTKSLVPAAETAATPEALALLRVLAAVGSPGPAHRGRAGGRPAQRPRRGRSARGRPRSALRRSATAGTTPTSAAARSR